MSNLIALLNFTFEFDFNRRLHRIHIHTIVNTNLNYLIEGFISFNKKKIICFSSFVAAAAAIVVKTDYGQKGFFFFKYLFYYDGARVTN